jgi:phage-related protein
MPYGGMPSDFKPMSTVGDGVFRVMYVARFSEAVYVLHAFQKKTQRTSKLDTELAQRRYKLIGDRL